MASALGVNVNRIYIQAFTLGCFMAGLGGAIVVPSQSAVLGMGVDALVLAFIVVVIGGLGSLEGALAGALIVGVVREAGITWFPEVELAVLYLIAALVLLVRPAGLFGRASNMNKTCGRSRSSRRRWRILAWVVPAALLLLVAPLGYRPVSDARRSPTASSPPSGRSVSICCWATQACFRSATRRSSALAPTTVAFHGQVPEDRVDGAVPRRLRARLRSFSRSCSVTCACVTRASSSAS